MTKNIENPCTKGWKDYIQFRWNSVCQCSRDLHNTITIITGANSGIGFETCKVLADKGSKIIMACRSEQRATDAKNLLLKENKFRDLEIELVDMSNISSIRSFAKRICDKYDKIDILINNAGVFTKSTLSDDGYEIHFAVNHLAPFLLTNLLLDKLKKSQDGRIINVSSSGHVLGIMDTSRCKKPGISKVFAYGDSKLYNILFTKELGKRLEGSSVTTFSLNPGSVKTKLNESFSDNPIEKLIFNPIFKVIRPGFKSPLQGAQTIIHAALNSEITQHSGSYLTECQVTQPSSTAQSSENAEIIWAFTENLIKL